MCSDKETNDTIKEIFNPLTTKERINEILNNIFTNEDKMFRKLNTEEEKEFIKYAEENDPPNMEDWSLYHPICRKTWIKKGKYPKWLKLMQDNDENREPTLEELEHMGSKYSFNPYS